jgi:hypothetical protein
MPGSLFIADKHLVRVAGWARLQAHCSRVLFAASAWSAVQFSLVVAALFAGPAA